MKEFIKLFHKKVKIPEDGSKDSFIIQPCGLHIEVVFTKIKLHTFDVLNIRLIINNGITTSIDFTIDFIKDNEFKPDRILLSNIFNAKIVKQIMLDLYE